MKRGKRNIRFSNRWLYSLISFGILIAIAIGVYAYGTSNPTTFGHTMSEIGCTNDFCYTNGKIGIGTTTPRSNISVGGAGTLQTGIYTYGTEFGLYANSTNGDGVYATTSTYDYFALEGYAPNSVGIFGRGLEGVQGYGDSSDFMAVGPGTNYGAVSSMRWKDNIVTITGALAKVLAIRGVYFDWNEEHGGSHDMGFIAEEVGDVVPEVVSYEDASDKTNHYNLNGQDKVYASAVDYGALTPLLVEAIKELKQENDQLKKELCEKDNSYSWC